MDCSGATRSGRVDVDIHTYCPPLNNDLALYETFVDVADGLLGPAITPQEAARDALVLIGRGKVDCLRKCTPCARPRQHEGDANARAFSAVNLCHCYHDPEALPPPEKPPPNEPPEKPPPLPPLFRIID